MLLVSALFWLLAALRRATATRSAAGPHRPVYQMNMERRGRKETSSSVTLTGCIATMGDRLVGGEKAPGPRGTCCSDHFLGCPVVLALVSSHAVTWLSRMERSASAMATWSDEGAHSSVALCCLAPACGVHCSQTHSAGSQRAGLCRSRGRLSPFHQLHSN